MFGDFRLVVILHLFTGKYCHEMYCTGNIRKNLKYVPWNKNRHNMLNNTVHNG